MAKQMKSFRLSEEAIAVIEHRNRELYRSGQAYVESLLLGEKKRPMEEQLLEVGKAAEMFGFCIGTEEKNRREQTAIYPAAL